MDIKRLQLERKIVDAAEGELTKAEIDQLKEELRAFPDLLEDFNGIIRQPDFAEMYGPVPGSDLFDGRIQSIINKIESLEKQRLSFEAITLLWFRKYALAASISILALTSLYSAFWIPDDPHENELIMSELFYPYIESEADDYVIYLEEISIQ